MNLSEYPRVRLGLTLILTVVIGVLSSVLATQIMPNGKLDLSLLLNASALWWLLGVTLFWLLVQVLYLSSDKDLLRYTSDEHCGAVIRKAKLEAIAADLRKNPHKAYQLDSRALRIDLAITRSTEKE